MHTSNIENTQTYVLVSLKLKVLHVVENTMFFRPVHINVSLKNNMHNIIILPAVFQVRNLVPLPKGRREFEDIRE